MNDAVRLFFDENIGSRIYKALIELLKFNKEVTIETAHLVLDYHWQGEWDEAWTPKLRDEGWIVISADRGRKSGGKGQALPVTCRKNNITHVLISGKLHNRQQFEKACALIEVREKLFSLRNEPKGSCWLLQLGSEGPAKLRKKDHIMRGRPSIYKRGDTSEAGDGPPSSTS